MSIAASDIEFYKAANNNDTAANGGRISSTEVTDSALNNLFLNVSSAERTAGLTRYRKAFLRNENTSDLTMYSGEIWIGSKSTSDNYYQLKEGTDTDVQTDAEGYSDWCGTGLLDAAAGSGESSIDVDYDAASGVWDGAPVHIDDGTNEVDLTVNGAPSWAGNTATLTLSGVLGYNFAKTTTIVSTIVALGQVKTATARTVTDSWTLTFSDATNFSVTGTNTGSVGSGDINTDFQPANGSSYYFMIDKDGWGGSWAAGETVTFTTTHAGKGYWAKEVTPAAIASYSNNTTGLAWRGESA